MGYFDKKFAFLRESYRFAKRLQAISIEDLDTPFLPKTSQSEIKNAPQPSGNMDESKAKNASTPAKRTQKSA